MTLAQLAKSNRYPIVLLVLGFPKGTFQILLRGMTYSKHYGLKLKLIRTITIL